MVISFILSILTQLSLNHHEKGFTSLCEPEKFTSGTVKSSSFSKNVKCSDYKEFESLVLKSLKGKNLKFNRTLTNSNHKRFLIIKNKAVNKILSNEAYSLEYYKELFTRKYFSELDWKINILLYCKFKISNFSIISDSKTIENIWRREHKTSDGLFWKKFFGI